MSNFLFFNLVNNLNNYVNYYFIIIIVPEKPHWGGSIKYSFISNFESCRCFSFVFCLVFVFSWSTKQTDQDCMSIFFHTNEI